MDCNQPSDWIPPTSIGFSRRNMLGTLSCGFGLMAFAGLAGASALRLDDEGAARRIASGTHHMPRAKRVIFLSMAGGPSHVDTFDYKPELSAADGTSLGQGIRRGAKLLKSPWEFKAHGKSGLYISSLFPAVAQHADELCLLRSMKTDVPAHPQAQLKMHTGSFQFVRPSMGSWLLYGLGSGNDNLPGFITINPQGGAQTYGCGFLPAPTQGTPIRMQGGGRATMSGAGAGQGALPNISNPLLTREAQREQLDLVQKLNKERLKRDPRSDQIEGVIESYELAFRMQMEVPDVLDVSDEDPKTLALYGIGEQETDGFGKQCLMARRLSEAGVRFVEVTAGGWDTHRNMKADLEKKCGEIDRPIAGLLSDLKRRGMLKDTLVIWGGEFGRTPYAQGDDGRDHNNKGFAMWMAGGGVKGGFSYGSTDPTGAEAVENPMDIHDWHATILWLMGFDHERLTYNHAGRDFRLTDVKGNVHTGIMA
ncbi:MAG: DUF1501 domain-containing protein [Bacteroidia bacterium]|nr:DUF1501 domain-containing protein [Bacteroidia bacterium]